VRVILILVTLAGCGKVSVKSDAPIDTPTPLGTPMVTITTHPIAGAPVQCKATVAGGTAPVALTATWTKDAVDFPGATQTTFAGDTVPGSQTHTGNVYACTVTATDATGAKKTAAPEGVVVDGRFAFVITQAGSPTVGTLLKINLDNNTLTFIGATGVAYSFGDLAWDPTTQTLFMADGEEADTALYTVDTATGTATKVGSHGASEVLALAYDATTDTLLASALTISPPTTGKSFFSINKTTAASTGLGGAGSTIEGLAFDTKRGKLVAITGGTGTISTVDPGTGTATQVATPGAVSDCGMTYDPIVDKFWVVDFNGKLFQYDPANNFAQTLVTTFTGNAMSAIALFIPPAM
jgi:hypothetical protein